MTVSKGSFHVGMYNRSHAWCIQLYEEYSKTMFLTSKIL